jgi:hypothetical protein
MNISVNEFKEEFIYIFATAQSRRYTFHCFFTSLHPSCLVAWAKGQMCRSIWMCGRTHSAAALALQPKINYSPNFVVACKNILVSAVRSRPLAVITHSRSLDTRQ